MQSVHCGLFIWLKTAVVVTLYLVGARRGTTSSCCWPRSWRVFYSKHSFRTPLPESWSAKIKHRKVSVLLDIKATFFLFLHQHKNRTDFRFPHSVNVTRQISLISLFYNKTVKQIYSSLQLTVFLLWDIKCL